MAVQEVFTEDDLILLLSEAEDEVAIQLFAQSLLDAACCKRDEDTQQSEVYLRLPIYPNSPSWDSRAARHRRQRDIDPGGRGSLIDATEVSSKAVCRQKPSNITIKDQHQLFFARVHRQNRAGGVFLPIPEDLQDQDSSNERAFLRTIPVRIPEDQDSSYEQFLRTIPEDQDTRDTSNEVCP